jgi:hypothetical protein
MSSGLGNIEIGERGGKVNSSDIVLTLQGEQLTLHELFERLSRLTAELEGQVKELVADKDRLDWLDRNWMILGRVFRFCDRTYLPRQAIDLEMEEGRVNAK